LELDRTDKELLKEIADWDETPSGAYNIRKNGAGIARRSTPGITIVSKTDQPGMDIIVEPGTVNQSVHIPVVLTIPGYDTVYNTFEIGPGADVSIIAGCGIHSSCGQKSQHDGIHEFFIRKGAKIRYLEKHFGAGGGSGERVLNPVTIMHLEEDAVAELEMVQIRGVTHTRRKAEVFQRARSRLIVNERLLTHEQQQAYSEITVHLEGEGSSAEVLSRSVGQDQSLQVFKAGLIGYSPCKGHVACDSVIMGTADIRSLPELWAKHPDAELTHEASIGKLAGDQIVKLMTFGLTEAEAVRTLLEGYLK
jgi:Fe-S cluster assembly scaffold protein SufB